MDEQQRQHTPAEPLKPIPNKLHRLTVYLAHYFALFRGLGLPLGYIATSGAKSDFIFLLSDPDFL